VAANTTAIAPRRLRQREAGEMFDEGMARTTLATMFRSDDNATRKSHPKIELHH